MQGSLDLSGPFCWVNCYAVTSVVALQEGSLRNRWKVALALSLGLIAYLGVDSYLHQRQIAAIERKTYNQQIAFYKSFLKPGMTRADVEREFRERSILFSQRYEKRVWEDFVLLERFKSPVWYCNFEDAGLLFEFDPAGTVPNYENGDPFDRLREMSVHRELRQCL
jgi:hypothetical protein